MIALLPMFACAWVIFRKDVPTALVQVVLPTLLLTASYYSMVIKPLPGTTMIQCSLVPLIAAMALFHAGQWRFSVTDIVVLIFIFAGGYTDHQLGKTQGFFTWYADAIDLLGFYMAGKLLIEQTGFRQKFVGAYVKIIFFCCALGSVEFFLRYNVYAHFWNHFFPTQYSPYYTQIRWGFGRMAGPFGNSEDGGIVIFTGLLLALWIGRPNFQEKAHRAMQFVLGRGKIYIWGIAIGLYMTQERGPWIGGLIAIFIATIGRSKKPGLRAVFVITLLVGVGVPVYTFAKSYSAGPRKNYGSEQETAQYRAQLIEHYVPVAEKSGPWGYGLNFPQIGGQDSIDNAYLLTWLQRGWIGLACLIYIVAMPLVTLTMKAMRATTTRELHFCVTLIGIFVGYAFTISTVYLGEQSPFVLFLLLGWSQAIRPERAALPAAAMGTASRRVAPMQAVNIYT